MTSASKLKLPLLAAHRAALENCVYCPKLSRATCPVSNVEASETVTPWGKMSLAYFSARGDVPIDADHAAPAWACSACYACRERCEHKNEVAQVLIDARAEYYQRGVAPAACGRVVAGFAERQRSLAQKALAFGAGGDARTLLVLGCSYLLHLDEVSRAIVEVTRRLLGAARVVARCCGLPLLHAGDRHGFLRAARALAADLEGAERVVIADPGCARAVSFDFPRLGVTAPPVEILVDSIYARLDRLQPAVWGEQRFRYHDPCQLGRGLGRYEEPRAIVARVSGAPPEDLPRSRAAGECSGGGGLLPATRPETSRQMAAERLAEHRAGGGTLVTACASSLRRFRSLGEPALDLMELVAKALPSHG
jgi:Fe-S oxidoreductase